MKTLLVPNAWNTVKCVEHIATVIKSYGRNGSAAIGETKLLCFERVMEASLAAKTFQL